MSKEVYFRFSNIDNCFAVQEHRKILDNSGEVFWGIFKKSYEKIEFDREEKKWQYYKSFGSSDSQKKAISGQMYLLNIKAQKHVKVTATLVSKSEVDISKVPDYYSKDFKRVNVWLKITEMGEEEEFSNDLGKKINLASDDVVLFCNKKPPQKTIKLDVDTFNILHLSDLHFSKGTCKYKEQMVHSEESRSPQVNVSLKDKIINCLNGARVDLILVSGDFIHGKAFSTQERKIIDFEFDIVANLLKDLCKSLKLDPKKNLLLVPGNHDIALKNGNTEKNDKIINEYDFWYKRFQKELIGEEELTYLREYSSQLPFKIQFFCFNSSDSATVENKDYGYIENRQLKIFDYYGISDEKDCIRFAIMHHPIVGPPTQIIAKSHEIKEKENEYISDPISVLLNGFDICSQLQAKGIRWILNGHQHMPYYGKHVIANLTTKKKVDCSYIVAGSAGLDVNNNGMYESYKDNSINFYSITSDKKIECKTFFFSDRDNSDTKECPFTLSILD